MLSTKSEPKLKRNEPAASWQFEAIGTHWWIGIYQPIQPTLLALLKRQVHARIEAYDKAYSRFRDDSIVSEMSRRAGTYRLPDDAMPLLELYRKLYDATRGAVTPLIGNVLHDAGYDAHYSLQPGELTTPPAWDDVLTVQGATVTTSKPVILDIGAAGKGYLVDIIAALLQEHGVEAYCIDAGGDMVVRGTAPLRIGLEHPDDTSQAIGVVTLDDMALCGSAGNRRAWAGLHHIMNPFTLQPVHDVKAVWVMAVSTAFADGLTTALFFVPPSQLRGFDFEYLIVDGDNNQVHSAGFPVELCI